MYKWLALAALVAYSVAIPIENGVEGDPEIECGPTSITINFNTQNNFQGHVYVKGQFDTAGCRNDEGGRQVAGISLPFDTCGTARTRSLNPKGVFVTNTVVVSFHPKFETKVDRAYRIQCFYMEADKTVSTELEVSMLTTGFQTQVVPMPVCRYEILTGGPSGTPVQYALIGDAVYHKWTCDTETVDTFCMVVHSCFVDDGNADRVDLLTAEGCAIDKFLLNNLEYPTDLMAGQEAHVFKYADRAQLFFQCQITITVKEPAAECPRPTCTVPEGFATGGAIPAGGAAGSAGAAGAGAAGAGAASVDAPAAARPAPAAAARPAPAAAAPRPRPTPAPAAAAAAATTKAPATPPAAAAPAVAAAAETTAAPAASAAPAATTAAPAAAAASTTAAAATTAAPAVPAAAAEEKPASGEESPPAQLRVLKKRQADWERDNAGVMDVRASVKTLDIDDRVEALPDMNQSSKPSFGRYGEPIRVSSSQDGICLSSAGFSILLVISAVIFAALVVIATCMLRPNRKY